MNYFMRKSAQWLSFLAATVAFFSLPIILRGRGPVKMVELLEADGSARGVVLEFLHPVPGTAIAGDSTRLNVFVDSDTVSGSVSLFVNGRQLDESPVSGESRLNFPAVYVGQEENEIEALFRSPAGDTIAAKKLRIISQKK